MSVITIQLEEQERLRLINTINDFKNIIKNDTEKLEQELNDMDTMDKVWLISKYNELLQKLDK